MASESETAIAKVLQYYYPHWEVPDNEKDWNPCLCPDHEEDRPSCAVNFEVGAVKCLACGFKGNVISIIQRKEGVRYAEALRHAEEILGGRYDAVQGKPARKQGRRVFGSSGTEPRGPAGKQVSSGIRGRSTPWT